MSLGTTGGNLFTRHPKNINHAHKRIKVLLSVIIALRTNVNGSKTLFNGTTMNDIGGTEHVFNHSHGRCVVGAFDKKNEGYIWTEHRAV